jgi:hypothetical protein
MWTSLPSICELVPAVKPLVGILFVSVRDVYRSVRLVTLLSVTVNVVLCLKCCSVSAPVSLSCPIGATFGMTTATG